MLDVPIGGLQSPAGSLLEDDVENAAYVEVRTGVRADWKKEGLDMVDNGRSLKAVEGRKRLRGIERVIARRDIILENSREHKRRWRNDGFTASGSCRSAT